MLKVVKNVITNIRYSPKDIVEVIGRNKFKKLRKLINNGININLHYFDYEIASLLTISINYRRLNIFIYLIKNGIKLNINSSTLICSILANINRADVYSDIMLKYLVKKVNIVDDKSPYYCSELRICLTYYDKTNKEVLFSLINIGEGLLYTKYCVNNKTRIIKDVRCYYKFVYYLQILI